MTTPADNGAQAARAHHRALLYGDPGEFVDAVASFIRDGLRAGDDVFVALTAEKRRWLREALGDAADAVEAVDAAAVYERNGPMLNGLLQRFLGRGGERRTRVVAEQALAARSEVETRAYLRYEAAANVAYEPFAASVLCPYDRARLPDAVLMHALRTHPEVVEPEGARGSEHFTDPRVFLRRHSIVEPPPPDATEMALSTLDDVGRVRHHIAEVARTAGLAPAKVDEVAVAATELATNALRHGEAPCRVWTYVRDGAFVCHVHDHGSGLDDPLAGYLVPDLFGTGGRGLWLAHQLCDIVEAAADASGSHVYVRMLLRDGWSGVAVG